MWLLACCYAVPRVFCVGCYSVSARTTQNTLVFQIDSSHLVCVFDEQVLDYNYRSAVREMITQLSFLDDVPAEEDKPQGCRTSQQDWTLLKESIKDGSINDCLENTNTDKGKDKQLLPRLSEDCFNST